MSTDVGRGILAPRSGSVIRDGAAEMRTLGATAASAINEVDLRVGAELAQKIGKTEAYENLVPRDEAVRYGIPGPRGPEGPSGEGEPGPPGPGGSIALEETDPGCFVDSEITWMQWDTSVGTVARAWNPNTETYHMIFGDTGRRDISQSHATEDVAVNGRLWIQRTNDTVTVSMYDIDVLSSGSVNVFQDIPSGYRPIDREGFVLSLFRDTNVEAIMLASSFWLYSVPDRTGDKRIRSTISWKTNDPWPTVEPGVPYHP